MTVTTPVGSRASRAHRNSPTDALLLDFQFPPLGNNSHCVRYPVWVRFLQKSQQTKTTPQTTIKSLPGPGPFWCSSAENCTGHSSHSKARTQRMLPGHILQPELIMLFFGKYLQLHFPCFPQQLSLHLLPFLLNDLTSSN